MKGDIDAFASSARKTCANTLRTKYRGPISYIEEEVRKYSTIKQPNPARIVEDFDR